MPTGPGFWLDPRNGALHRVTTHNDWLIDPQNQKKVGLTPTQIEVLATLDPVKEIDEIRMVGVMARLIRIRDYANRVSVQFYAPPAETEQSLRAAVKAMPTVSSDKHPFLTIQNLHDDSTARIHLSALVAKLQKEESVLHPSTEPILYNNALRRKMDRLLGKQSN